VVVTAAVAVVMLLATVITALAVGIYRVKEEQLATDKERQAALLAHQRTQEEYRLAREALAELVQKVTDHPRLATGELEELRRVVWQAQALFFQKFVQLHGDEPEFQEERGMAYLDLGDVTGKLGTRVDALAAYQEALRIFTDLVRDYREVPRYRAALARSHRSLGQMYRGIGRRAEAIQAYQEALALQKVLVAEDQSRSEYQYDLAVTYGNLAVVYQETRRRAEAEKVYQDVVTLVRNLIRDHRMVPEYQVVLANSYTNLGLIYMDTGRSGEAEQVLQEALSLRREVVKALPKPDCRRQLAITCNTLAELYQTTGRLQEAGQAYQEGLGPLEILVKDHPFVRDYAADLGAYQVNLGNLDRDLGMLPSSLDWYGKAIQTLEGVLRNEASHSRARQFLAQAYRKQFQILNRLSRYDDALAVSDRAIHRFPENHLGNLWRLERAKTLAKLRRHTEATVEASELRSKFPSMDAGVLIRFAELYSLASSAARDDDDPVQDEQYAVQAVELLQQAVAQGYKDVAKLKTHGDFDAIRSRPDFQKLLVELEQSQQSHRP
jgi:tetratricopeptide (TPR) repeat protein